MFCPGISNDSNNNKKSFFFLFFFRICICVCAVHRQKMWLKCLLTYQAPYCMNRYTIILKLKWTAKWRVMRSHCKIYFFFFRYHRLHLSFFIFQKMFTNIYRRNVGRTCISQTNIFFFHYFLSTFYRKRFYSFVNFLLLFLFALNNTRKALYMDGLA